MPKPLVQKILKEAGLDGQKRSFDSAIQAGINDLENDRYTELQNPEELQAFLDAIEEEIFDAKK